MGFLIEKIDGGHGEIGDLAACQSIVKHPSLHSLGIVHGDLNKYNFIVGPTRTTLIIDFENAIKSRRNLHTWLNNWQRRRPVYARYPLKCIVEAYNLHFVGDFQGSSRNNHIAVRVHLLLVIRNQPIRVRTMMCHCYHLSTTAALVLYNMYLPVLPRTRSDIHNPAHTKLLVYVCQVASRRHWRAARIPDCPPPFKLTLLPDNFSIRFK